MNKKIVRSTLFGPVGIIWNMIKREPKIVRVLLSTPDLSAEIRVASLYPNSYASSCARIDKTAAGFQAFLEGEDISFPLDLAYLNQCGDFQKKVLRAEHRIPRGSVSTYGLIAAQLSKPGGARAVGNALANNPFPLIVPCHRAIRSDRSLGGYQGGLEMKQALLSMEGIAFSKAGRVASPRLHYGRHFTETVGIRI